MKILKGYHHQGKRSGHHGHSHHGHGHHEHNHHRKAIDIAFAVIIGLVLINAIGLFYINRGEPTVGQAILYKQGQLEVQEPKTRVIDVGPMRCVDSDAGVDAKNAGAVSSYQGDYLGSIAYDFCRGAVSGDAQDHILIERSCEEGSARKVEMDCATMGLRCIGQSIISDGLSGYCG